MWRLKESKYGLLSLKLKLNEIQLFVEPSPASMMDLYNFFRKKLHHRCLVGFEILLWNRINPFSGHNSLKVISSNLIGSSIHQFALDIILSHFTLRKKLSFPLRIPSVNPTKSAVSTDLVTFTEEILNGKIHFLCRTLYALVQSQQ